jgi:hypothetical protein
MPNNMFSNKGSKAEFLREYEKFWVDSEPSTYEIKVYKDGRLIVQASLLSKRNELDSLKQLLKNLDFTIGYVEGDEYDSSKY